MVSCKGYKVGKVDKDGKVDKVSKVDQVDKVDKIGKVDMVIVVDCSYLEERVNLEVDVGDDDKRENILEQHRYDCVTEERAKY